MCINYSVLHVPSCNIIVLRVYGTEFCYFSLSIDLLSIFVGILNFTQSSEAVTPQGNITFRCEATGDEVEWRINGETKFSSYGEFIIGTPVDSLHWTLTLTVQATIHNNGTNVSCFASNSEITNQYVIQTKTFIIAGNVITIVKTMISCGLH